MTEGFKTLGIGGHYILVGAVFPGPKLNFMAEVIVKNMLTLSGCHNYRPQDLQAAVSFLDQYHQDYPFQDFIANIFPLKQINEAFEFAKDKRPLRLMIRPHGNHSTS